MEWKEKYSKKVISAEKAANFVKSGNKVVFTTGREAWTVGLAIAARKEELRGVRIYAATPTHDFGWYDPGWEDSFELTIGQRTLLAQEAADERRCDVQIGGLMPFMDVSRDLVGDVLLTEISTPDDNGFCSFGASLWHKKRQIALAKEYGALVIAEVNKNLIRTYGDNFIHISEFDYLVEHKSSGGSPGMGTLAGREPKEADPDVRAIAKFVSTLIKDRDTLQMGVGRTSEPLVQLGILDGKHDIGWHSEATPPGIIRLVREGVITGKYKTIYPGKAVVTSIGGGTQDEMAWVNNNPLFYLVDVAFLEDIRTIAGIDNFVAINNALSIDITGQISAESIGPLRLANAGGQVPFVMGAWLSKGGRAITVLPSTAKGGKVSRIRPLLMEGTQTTIPRSCADIIVTEYGVAHLRGKTLRQRTMELIAISHPDFRDWLHSEARKLYWP